MSGVTRQRMGELLRTFLRSSSPTRRFYRPEKRSTNSPREGARPVEAADLADLLPGARELRE